MKFILILTAFTLSPLAHAQDGPLRWAYHQLWGYPTPAPRPAAPVLNNHSTTTVNTTVDTGQGEIAAVEWEKLRILEEEKRVVREAAQARYTARMNEIQTVNDLLYQSSLSKGLPFEFTYEGVQVKEKKIVSESKLDDLQSACNRQTSDTLVTLLSYDEYKQALLDAKITKVSIELFDNRNSSRSDNMFAVGGTIGVEKTIPSQITYYIKQDGRWVKTDKITYLSYIDESRKKVQSAPKAVGGFKVSSLLTADGKCVDFTDELLAEFELLAHPGDAKKLGAEVASAPTAKINEDIKKDVLAPN